MGTFEFIEGFLQNYWTNLYFEIAKNVFILKIIYICLELTQKYTNIFCCVAYKNIILKQTGKKGLKKKNIEGKNVILESLQKLQKKFIFQN